MKDLFTTTFNYDIPSVVLKTANSYTVPTPSHDTPGELLYLIDTQTLLVSNGTTWNIVYKQNLKTCSTCSFRDAEGCCLLKSFEEIPYVHPDNSPCDNYFNELEFNKNLYSAYPFS